MKTSGEKFGVSRTANTHRFSRSNGNDIRTTRANNVSHRPPQRLRCPRLCLTLKSIPDCGIELESCTLTDLCDYTRADGGDVGTVTRTIATGDMAGSSGAVGSFSGSFGGSVFRAAGTTLIGLLGATLGLLL